MLRPYHTGYIKDLYTAVRESLAELIVWMPWAHADYSIDESRWWLKERSLEWQAGIAFDFAILDARDDSYVGGCSLNRIDYDHLSANLGYWIRSSRSGQGLAKAAVLILSGWGFGALGLKRIEMYVAAENQRSQRVAVKAGAIQEGILRNGLVLHGVAHDAVLFSLIPGEV